MGIPSEIRSYLNRIVQQLSVTLGDRLVGVYLVGSLALGDYRSGHSDVDVYAVVPSRLSRDEKLAIARDCGNHAIACPAKRLELVVLSAGEARDPSQAPQWELNLNTGSWEPDHVGLDPSDEPSHWFVVDLALASLHGIALFGPPAHELIASPLPSQIRAAQMAGIVWYAKQAMPAEAAMAACRAWHWQRTGRFASKRQALRWAEAQP